MSDVQKDCTRDYNRSPGYNFSGGIQKNSSNGHRKRILGRLDQPFIIQVDVLGDLVNAFSNLAEGEKLSFSKLDINK
jgi:hypothetical protein